MRARYQAGRASYRRSAWATELAAAGQAIRAELARPHWNWAGVGVALLLALGGLGSSIRETHTDEVLLTSPRAGDIYTVRSGPAAMYSLLKVRQVSGNSVELLANNYQTDVDSPISSLNEPARYGTEPIVLTRLDLQIMRRKGQLTDVDRP